MIIKQLRRGPTVERLGCGVLGRLFTEVDMQWTLPGCLADLGESLSGNCPNRVCGGADAYSITVLQRADPVLPVINISVGEAGLEGIKRQMATGSEPSGEIANVDQGEPDASLGRGLDQRVTHGIRIGVRVTMLIMVEIVELTDRGEPGQCHLGEHRTSE
jgi:hypothetical protein